MSQVWQMVFDEASRLNDETEECITSYSNETPQCYLDDVDHQLHSNFHSQKYANFA